MNSERYQATLALIDRLEEVKNKSMGPHDAQAALNDFSGKPDPDGPWHAEIGFCGGVAAPVVDLAALLQEVFAAGVVKGSSEVGIIPTRCRCGAMMVGDVCGSDPRPPRCAKCHHALSHGECPQCNADRWRRTTGKGA